MLALIVFIIELLMMAMAVIWIIFFEEKHMSQVIRNYIDNIKGELISIQYINKRGKVFTVTYKLGDEVIRQNVIYHSLGELEWLQ